jgi:16S rRNA processing protein RimM
MSDAGPTADKLVALGRITRTQGHAGAVRLLPFFSPAQLIEQLKTPRVYVGATAHPCQGDELPLQALSISSIWYHKQFAILTFDQIPDMNAAERLSGRILYCAAENLWELEEDQYFAYELVGMRVISAGEDQAELGRVVALEDGLAHDYLRVAGVEKEFLVPFVRAMIKMVDRNKRLIRVDLPEGLVDL